VKSYLPGFSVFSECLPVAQVLCSVKGRTSLWVQCAGRLGWAGLQLPPLPSWKSLHCQLPLLTLISLISWRALTAGQDLECCSLSMHWLNLGSSDVSYSVMIHLQSLVYLKCRSVTPPNTPQCNQDAAHHRECDQRIMSTKRPVFPAQPQAAPVAMGCGKI